MDNDLDPPYLRSVATIHLGCTLGYRACMPTLASFIIQPHRQCAVNVLKESLLASSGSALKHGFDQHGNCVLTTTLVPGPNEFRYEAIVELPHSAEFDALHCCAASAGDMPLQVLRYTLPSRYCESDKLHDFAREKFGHLPRGFTQAQAICDWVGHHFEYRHGSGDATLSACDAMQRGFGVCRDFAHIVIALCRAIDLPARYVAGHIPIMAGNEIIGENDIGIDFHAYAEVYVNGYWHTFDARYNQPLKGSIKGRIKIAHGMDAVDAAFATFYGNVDVLGFEVWARQVEPMLAKPALESHATSQRLSMPAC
jgi:transglutaminase-like putative cysteine protease